MIAQFLTEMDYCMNAGNIYVIGATNRPDLLDPAILQPGRFDVSIYLGVDDQPSTRLSILQAKTRKMALEPGVSLEAVEALLPKGQTGADIFAFVSKAYALALGRTQQKLADLLGEKGQGSLREFKSALEELPASQKEVRLSMEDFKQALPGDASE